MRFIKNNKLLITVLVIELAYFIFYFYNRYFLGGDAEEIISFYYAFSILTSILICFALFMLIINTIIVLIRKKYNIFTLIYSILIILLPILFGLIFCKIMVLWTSYWF